MNRLFLLLLLPLFSACHRNSGLSVVPKITYYSLQPKIIQAGASTGGTTISFGIQDGDGDIGFGKDNLYLKDSRDGSMLIMKMPIIPAEYSPQRGLKATVTVDFLSAWLQLRPDTTHINRDTLQWEIYLVDEAGHKSNTMLTDTLYLFK
jgi:hypothetical protein